MNLLSNDGTVPTVAIADPYIAGIDAHVYNKVLFVSPEAFTGMPGPDIGWSCGGRSFPARKIIAKRHLFAF